MVTSAGSIAIAFVFFAVRFGGYYFVGRHLRMVFERPTSDLLFALTRTLIGLVLGTAGYLYLKSIKSQDFYYWSVLVPVRFAVWFLVIALFFGKRSAFTFKGLKWSVLGTIFSCALDLPSVLAAGLFSPVVGGRGLFGC